MSKVSRAVPLPSEHMNSLEGADQMDTKIITSGNTRIIVHSTLINLNESERKEKLQKMWDEKHPAVMRIAGAMSEVVQRKATS